jgi:hypothetical protein
MYYMFIVIICYYYVIVKSLFSSLGAACMLLYCGLLLPAGVSHTACHVAHIGHVKHVDWLHDMSPSSLLRI